MKKKIVILGSIIIGIFVVSLIAYLLKKDKLIEVSQLSKRYNIETNNFHLLSERHSKGEKGCSFNMDGHCFSYKNIPENNTYTYKVYDAEKDVYFSLICTKYVNILNKRNNDCESNKSSVRELLATVDKNRQTITGYNIPIASIEYEFTTTQKNGNSQIVKNVEIKDSINELIEIYKNEYYFLNFYNLRSYNVQIFTSSTLSELQENYRENVINLLNDKSINPGTKWTILITSDKQILMEMLGNISVVQKHGSGYSNVAEF